ncbi:Sulfate permease family protein 3 [Toxocara canis]|uniref:Sulfate permease family protein 3 n=1 Tax=Toxocara canis TaxID=6265 RepID=A0A0B2VM37_TOXCA|nr:Sulfate permease family protein 3 [Toxocara canis]
MYYFTIDEERRALVGMSEDANGPDISPTGSTRRAMNQEEFDAQFTYRAPEESLTRSRLKKFLRRYYQPCLSVNGFFNAVIGFIPIIGWLPKYSFRDNFITDVIGGLTVGIMHVPQGIAYASLARVDPVVGLYTSFFPPLLYMIFGTSRHNSIGSFAVVSLMAGLAADRLVSEYNSQRLPIHKELLELANNETGLPDELHPLSHIEVVSVLTLAIGLVNILMGMLHLEFITTYFSDQVVSGFSTAASMHVFVAQLKDVFSIRGLPKRTGFGQLFLRVFDIISHITSSNPYTIIIAVLSTVFLLVGKEIVGPFAKKKLRLPVPIPFELILVIIATILSSSFDAYHRYNVSIVNRIPTGLPVPKLPRFDLIPQLVGDAFGIAAVIVAVHISLAKMFAKKLDYEIDPGQELYAIGFASAASSFFPVYPMACSLGRTLVNVEAGTKTQLSALFSSALLFAVILFFGQYLKTLPMILMGMLHLEFITTYFSDQVVSGFSTAASMHVFVAQLKDVFSIRGLPKRTGFGQLFLRVFDIISHITSSNPYTIIIAVLSTVFLLVGKEIVGPFAKKKLRLPVPIPFELILVIIATILSSSFDAYHRYNVSIVNRIPTGLPVPKLPRFDLIPQLVGDAFGIAAVIVAVHISLAKMFAKKLDYEIDPGQELYAIGFASAASSFFPVYPMACSLGRTLVNVEAGTKTQLSALFSSALLFAVILFFGQYLKTLPMCVLSAIIIVALKGMFKKFGELKRLWILSTIDFLIWLVSFVATVGYDVMQGLVISIGFALMTTVFRTQWSRWHLLANLEGTNDFRDSERYHSVTTYSGICVLRFDSPLLFTNVERFKRVVYKVLKEWRAARPSVYHPHDYQIDDLTKHIKKGSRVLPEDKENPLAIRLSRHFVIDCSGFTFVDFMGVNALKEIFAEMRSQKVLVYFAAAKAPVRELFESSGFYRFVPKENFYPTIRDAVIIARQRQASSSLPSQHSELYHDPVEEMHHTQPLH